jgi:hypothetical protein
LGQKQTFASQKGMSALPPIATSIAFFGICQTAYGLFSGLAQMHDACLVRYVI